MVVLPVLGSVRAFPASVRDVDHDAVGPGPLHLEIGVTGANFGIRPGLSRGFGRQPFSMDLFQSGASITEVVDCEAEMMDASEIGPMRAHVRRPLILVVEHREMD